MRVFVIGLVSAAIVGALGSAGCGSSGEDPASAPAAATTTPPESTPIVIGAVLSLTGNLAPFGQAEQNALRVAETQINANGGVLGRRVEFKIVDDTSSAEPGATALKSLFGENLSVVIGPTGSPVATALHAIAFESQRVLLSPSASTPDLTGAEPAKSRWFFRTAASHALQARAIAIKVSSGFTGHAACSSLAIVAADDSYGNPIADGIAKTFAARGGTVVVHVKVPSKAKASYDAEAAQVVAASPDCQVVVTFPDVGIGYLQAFAKASKPTSRDWSTFQTIGANGLCTKAFVENGRTNPADPTSPTIGEGAYLVNLDLNPQTPRYEAFKNLYTAQFPLKAGETDLAGYTANAYDAAVLAALAMEKAGSADDASKIRDALYDVSSKGTAFGPADVGDAIAAIRAGSDVDYDGASGPVDLDDRGDVLAGYVVNVIKDGKIVRLPADTITVDALR